ncbi:hypothetical protein HAX54_041379 [Datura stramonium]|uniref:Uncharacterized protein n=1 Tax=Datura stramonium TaxID=4076 RepID=A0ABS8VSL5_DATST|nr:hypothetical protein [Datura stramonium]
MRIAGERLDLCEDAQRQDHYREVVTTPLIMLRQRSRDKEGIPPDQREAIFLGDDLKMAVLLLITAFKRSPLSILSASSWWHADLC